MGKLQPERFAAVFLCKNRCGQTAENKQYPRVSSHLCLVTGLALAPAVRSNKGKPKRNGKDNSNLPILQISELLFCDYQFLEQILLSATKELHDMHVGHYRGIDSRASAF